ncbi:MAG: polysaccharide pyruvyl transferase family protein [Armatimonadota bacterium]|nr:polysaccharide pyruvyl transferase family protein [Armatimonadota bacterium]
MTASAPLVVVSGYYGFGNMGDEAVLAGLVDAFRAAVPNIVLAVASAEPEATRAMHGVEAFDRFSWQEFRAQVRDCTAFVSGGGSLFQDVTSRRSIYYYLGTVAMAHFYRRPVMVCAQGIGPIAAAPARAVTAALLNRAALITVRDPTSITTLTSLGVSRPPVHLTADPVFALTPASVEEADLLLRREGVDLETPRVAFALRAWPPRFEVADGRHRPPDPDPRQAERERLVEAAAQAAAFVHRELRAQPVFIPMHPPGDRDLARAVAHRAGVPVVFLSGGYPPREMLALFGRMDLVVGMRLHALIFAAAQGVPVVGISYDPKVDGFLETVGRTSAAELTSITGDALVAALRHAWDSREEEAARLRERASVLRCKAFENGLLLRELLCV